MEGGIYKQKSDGSLERVPTGADSVPVPEPIPVSTPVPQPTPQDKTGA